MHAIPDQAKLTEFSNLTYLKSDKEIQRCGGGMYYTIDREP